MAQELAKIRRDALDYGVNGINMSVGSLDCVAREEVENQQASPFIIISPFVQLFITLSRKGSNRRLEFELGAWFEGSCGFALVLALSQMREHGLGPLWR